MRRRGSDQPRLLVLCPQPVGEAPGQRLKYEQYFEHWRANGYDVVVSPFMSARFYRLVYRHGRLVSKVIGTVAGYGRRCRDVLRLRRFDGVYVFLWVTPFGPAFSERLVCAFARSVVYDIDDLVFDPHHVSHANRAIGRLKGRGKPGAMMRGANHVITCTPHLDQVARQSTARTTMISSTIETRKYRLRAPHDNDHVPVVGWSGSHSTSPYMKLIAEPLYELSRSQTFRVRVVGDAEFTYGEVIDQAVQLHATAWAADAEIADIGSFDIGLYPLPNDDWVLGKSGLKALQYMALGVPVVATRIGTSPAVIGDDCCGFLVSTPHEWRARIEQLLTDPALRQRLGEAGRHRVEQYYSVEVHEPVYLSILDHVVRRRGEIVVPIYPTPDIEPS